MLAVIAPRSKAWTHSIPDSPQHIFFCWICRFDKYTHTHTHPFSFFLLLRWGRWWNAVQKRSMITCFVWFVVPEEAIDRLAIKHTPTCWIKAWFGKKEKIWGRNVKLVGSVKYLGVELCVRYMLSEDKGQRSWSTSLDTTPTHFIQLIIYLVHIFFAIYISYCRTTFHILAGVR